MNIPGIFGFYLDLSEKDLVFCEIMEMLNISGIFHNTPRKANGPICEMVPHAKEVVPHTKEIVPHTRKWSHTQRKWCREGFQSPIQTPSQ